MNSNKQDIVEEFKTLGEIAQNNTIVEDIFSNLDTQQRQHLEETINITLQEVREEVEKKYHVIPKAISSTFASVSFSFIVSSRFILMYTILFLFPALRQCLRALVFVHLNESIWFLCFNDINYFIFNSTCFPR